MHGRNKGLSLGGNIAGAALGAVFILSIVGALAWGSYLTYYSLITKGARSLDATVTTSVIAKLDDRWPAGGAVEGDLIQASVRKCVEASFDNERVYKTLGSVAGWHGWRDYTEAEIQLRAETLLTTCLNELDRTMEAVATTIAAAN